MSFGSLINRLELRNHFLTALLTFILLLYDRFLNKLFYLIFQWHAILTFIFLKVVSQFFYYTHFYFSLPLCCFVSHITSQFTSYRFTDLLHFPILKFVFWHDLRKRWACVLILHWLLSRYCTVSILSPCRLRWSRSSNKDRLICQFE